MAAEKEKLRRRLGEREVRRRLEGEAIREREEIGKLFGWLRLDEDQEGKGQGGVALSGEEEIQHQREEALKEARVGKAKDAVKIEVIQVEEEDIDSPADDGTPTKRKRTRNRRLKTKIKIEPDGTISRITGKDNLPSIPKATPARKDTCNMANNPLLKGALSSTTKPHPNLWKAFTSSPLYHPSNSTPALGAMYASLHKKSLTPVLSEKTAIWAGSEHIKPEGRRDKLTLQQRSAWPEMSEMKAEGQYRKDAGKERRLPLPRMDIMTREAVLREAGGISQVRLMSQEEKDTVCRELEKRTGEEISWCDRQPVRYWDFDRLESVSRERREENSRRRRGEPVCGPNSYAAAMGEQRRGPNMGLRGGFSGVGGRRQTGPPLMAMSPVPPVKLNPLDPKALSFGADGPGDGVNPLPGGWVFDEEFLKQRGDWEELLSNHL